MIILAPSRTSVMSWEASATQAISFCVLMRLAKSRPWGTAEAGVKASEEEADVGVGIGKIGVGGRDVCRGPKEFRRWRAG